MYSIFKTLIFYTTHKIPFYRARARHHTQQLLFFSKTLLFTFFFLKNEVNFKSDLMFQRKTKSKLIQYTPKIFNTRAVN